jgi:hypothetical protein
MAVSVNSASGSPNKANGKIKKIGIAVVVVVIVVALLYLFYPMAGVTNISTPETATITSSPSYFSVGGSVYGISLVSKYQSMAYVYVNRLPVFGNPLLNVTLDEGNMTKLGIGSNFADLGLTLESVSNSSIAVRITPLDISLQLAPDSGKVAVIGTLLAPHTGGSAATSSVTTTASTTVGSTTTTISQTNSTLETIMAALKKNMYYGLMLNYTVLYANTQNCTRSAYDTAFLKTYGSVPSGPSTYQNISMEVPYMMYNGITSLNGGNYAMSFSTKTVDPTYNNSKALVIKVNVSTSKVTNVTAEGLLKGENYTMLYNGYLSAINIGGACGISVS